MRVTKDNYPTLWRAMFYTLSGQYDPKAQRDVDGELVFNVPPAYSHNLARFNRRLKAADMTDDQLQTFCAGDEREMKAVCNDFGLHKESDFLTLFFNDWHNDN